MNAHVSSRCISVYAVTPRPTLDGTMSYAGSLTPMCVGGSQVTVEICPVSPEVDLETGAFVPDNPFIEFDLTPATARELALALIVEADRADHIRATVSPLN